MNAVVLSERPRSAQEAAALLAVTGGAARPGPPGPGQLLVRLRAAAVQTTQRIFSLNFFPNKCDNLLNTFY